MKINYHDHLYYNENRQKITDSEYDIIRKDLENLENQYPHLMLPESPTKKVGSIVSKELKTYAHNTPMLSLNNGYSEEEVKAFFLKFNKTFNDFKILAETKVDGLSASLIYENHKLERALTRGDGFQGEDITTNIVHVDNVKKKLPIDFPAKLEIRGEVFMPKDAFIKLNEERKTNNQQTFSTARNAASGSIRQLDPDITRQRKLSFFGYTIISKEKYFGRTLLDTRKILLNNNFALNTPSAICSSVKEMMAFYSRINDIRDELEYEIDGIVYKLNSYEQQEKMGATSRFPKWALAHKFPAEEVTTKIIDVKFQVGRTGSITPVAVLEEVLVGGVKISRATLHNQDEIKRLNINIGDIVKLQRAGDVIPKIIGVKEIANNKDKIKITFPSTCPSCNQKLIKTEKEVALRCINFDFCQEQIVYRISHFVSRQALNIEGLGEKQIRFLVEKGIIKNNDDIFLLKRKHELNSINLYQYDGWGKKSVENLFKAIEKSSTVSFDKFIYSLGIRHVGKELSITLSNNFKNLEELIFAFSNLDKESLPQCEGLGEVIINSLQSYFLNQKFFTLVANLKNHLNIEYPKNLSQGIYKDKKIVITGSFESFKRSEIEVKLRSLGFKVLSSVSKNTDFLIAGKDAGSKLQKAESMNIEIKGIDFVNYLMNN
jgi:DNA ligase (NAD+)